MIGGQKHHNPQVSDVQLINIHDKDGELHGGKPSDRFCIVSTTFLIKVNLSKQQDCFLSAESVESHKASCTILKETFCFDS